MSGTVYSDAGAGPVLSRACAFKFAADPTQVQMAAFVRSAGARRFAFNHHLARVKANLEQRATEIERGVGKDELTPSLSWSRFSFINEFIAWKNGRAADSPVNADGSVGLSWRADVCADVFECASVDAATALKNWKESRTGARSGATVGFPRFTAKHHSTPRFRIRSKSKPGETAPVRPSGPKQLRLPTIGDIRVHGSTRRLRRMMDTGRFHPHSATVAFEKGRWWITVQGVAAEFHHQRRSPYGRHPVPAGIDRGVKALAVIADTDGQILCVQTAVRALADAQVRLRRANKAYARTTPGSNGRKQAAARLTKIHARIARLRHDVHHKLSHHATTTFTQLTIEDLHVSGMTQLRTLSRSIADAGMADLGRMLTYKADWYGCQLTVADRWYPSSKTCSNCSHVKPVLGLGERTYHCDLCGHTIDRDANAAINLARWPSRQAPSPQPAAAA